MDNSEKHRREYHKKHYDKITINIKKPYKDIIKDKSLDLGKSVNQYIVDLIMADLDKRDY